MATSAIRRRGLHRPSQELLAWSCNPGHLRTSCTCASPSGQSGDTYDLKLDGLALQLDSADLEVDTDGANVALGVCVVSEPKQET